MRNFGSLLYLLPFICLAATQCAPDRTDSGVMTLEQLDSDIEQMISKVSADTLEKNIRMLAGFGTRHTLSETESDTFGIGAARRWIKSEMDRYSAASGGKLQVEFHWFIQEPGRRIPEPAELVNIVATLPGSDPQDDRYFVVSGHYDSRASDVMDAESPAPGANDDASGTAAVMEMARVMAEYDFPATIVFMAVAGEEQGLLGATQWAKKATENGLNIAGMFTNDIIGNHAAGDGALTDPDKVRLFAEGIPPERKMDPHMLRFIQTGAENDLPTRQLARTIEEAAESYVPGMDIRIIYRLDRYLRGGDHRSFLREGYPGVRFSEPHEDFRHQHQDVRVENGTQFGDLPEFVDYPYTARVTQVNIATLANLARSPKPPRHVGMNVSSLENDTRLRWESSESANLGGYEVLWRQTTSPYWQHKQFVGTETHFKAENLSKDNWIFGVRSVSEGGHIGIPVYPMPFRE